MAKPKNYYIRYKRAELEDYVKHPESCVKKITHLERIRFGPIIIGNFKDSIIRILSRKIGKYDDNLKGVVLDFRNTKVLNLQNDIRYDSPYSILNIQSCFYVFSPRKNAVVEGIVKHINPQAMETIITVIIYRVFNVKVTFKGRMKQEDVTKDKQIKIRIKDFHFNYEIPYIEGEMINSNQLNSRKIFDEVLDSGISESSEINPEASYEHNKLSNCLNLNIQIKQERESSEEFSTSSAKIKKGSKRKLDTEYIIDDQILKKIKTAPPSDSEELPINVKIEKDNESNIILQDTSEKSKKKKTKKKKRNVEDDFESSLLMMSQSFT